MKIIASNPPPEPKPAITYPAHFQYIPSNTEKCKKSFKVLAFDETTGIVVEVDNGKQSRKVGDFLKDEWIPFTDESSWKPIKMTSIFEG